MLAEQGADARSLGIREAAKAAGLDGVIVTSDESIAYLTGFRPMQLERLFAVVVTEAGGSVVVPALDVGQLTDAPPSLERVSYTAASDGMAELVAALGGVRSVGVEEDHIVFARAKALEQQGISLAPAGALVFALRARKSADEIEKIRRACGVIEDALRQVFAELRPGDVEWEVNARVESRLREQGATDTHALILFGENAANPHGQPGPRELRNGDVVCADLSACIDGYWGDLTRCATVGPPTEWARRAWEVVREAQAAAIEACRVGVTAREVDLAQRTLVEAASELGQCLHGAGHAIGLAIHEPPFLVPRIETPLEEGMVLTIEPGLYQPGIGGIRLEDDVVVGVDGPQILSTISLDLVELSSS
ncbi:MAG: aminopeptidase family protein [Actinomycetia bacterium]|nr:aminopeptidase family protein [Actinomycetes bacterium]